MSVTDLQFAVLSTLASGRQHGYALLKDAEAQLNKPVAVATAYACFDAMVGRGWISFDGDEIVQGRTRRYYTISAPGAQTLRERADQLASQARLAHERLRVNTGKVVTA